MTKLTKEQCDWVNDLIIKTYQQWKVGRGVVYIVGLESYTNELIEALFVTNELEAK